MNTILKFVTIALLISLLLLGYKLRGLNGELEKVKNELIVKSDSLERLKFEPDFYFCFDEIFPIVIPEKTTLKIGENFKAMVILAANNTPDEKSPIIVLGDSLSKDGQLYGRTDTISKQDWIGTIEKKALKIGDNNFHGIYYVPNSYVKGGLLEMPFTYGFDVEDETKTKAAE